MTPTGAVARHMLYERVRSMTYWSIGTSLLMVLMVAFYPSVRDSSRAIDDYVKSLPKGLMQAFGMTGESIASPAGYLVSQLYSTVYPIVVMILAFGLAAWSVAGSEADGTLELVLANPVSRRRVALERALGIAALAAILVIVSTAVLDIASRPVGLHDGLEWWALWSAALQMLAFVMVSATLVFAVGAATGSKGAAIAVGSAVAVLGFFVQALAPLSKATEGLRWGSPWYWLLRDNPVTTPPNWLNTLLPLGLAAAFVLIGVWAFDRRDLRF